LPRIFDLSSIRPGFGHEFRPNGGLIAGGRPKEQDERKEKAGALKIPAVPLETPIESAIIYGK